MTVKVIRRCCGIALVLLCLVILVTGCQMVRHSRGPLLASPASGSLRIATYNVHYILLSREEGTWGTSHWEARKVPLDKAFKSLNADIVAFQEMESFAGGNDDTKNLTRSWLVENNPDYSVAAVGPWQSFPSTQPLFYLHAKYRVLDQGWFFFSDTPDVIYAHTYNGSYPAFASWVQFEDSKSLSSFYVVNIHTDYKSRENRRKSIALVAERVRPWVAQNHAVFVTGDFNARTGSELHRMLEAEGFAFAPVRGSTYHFNRGLNLFGAIDHIAHTANAILVQPPAVVREKFGDVWPTDHYPVVADFTLQP